MSTYEPFYTLGMKHEVCVTVKLRSGKIGENTEGYGYTRSK